MIRVMIKVMKRMLTKNKKRKVQKRKILRKRVKI